MRSPNVLRKLLLIAVALATAGLIFQACDTNPQLYPFVWPPDAGPKPHPVNPTECTAGEEVVKDWCRLGRCVAALEESKDTTWEISFHYRSGNQYETKKLCKKTTDETEDMRRCEPVQDRDAIHAAHQIRFPDQLSLDTFKKKMGLL